MVLAGDGSDEVNGGYTKFARIDDLLRWRRIRHAVPGVDPMLDRIARAFPSNTLGQRIKRWNQITHERAGAFAAFGSTAMSAGSDTNASFFAPEIATRFDGMTQAVEDSLLDGYHDLEDPRQRFFVYDMRGWLANELLIRADKITMAHSLEGRVPYLDHELVELCLAMPSRLKVRNGTTKAILRRAMQDRLPQETTKRVQHGFVVPLHDWIRNDWRELVSDLVIDTRTRSRGIFDHARIERIVDEHLRGRADWTSPIFGFLMTELWHRRFMDNESL